MKSRKRIKTGVPGLDDVLKAVAQGDRVLYVTLSELAEELQGSAESHEWDFAQVPVVEFVPQTAASLASSNIPSSIQCEVELSSTITRLTEAIDQGKPDGLVIVSLSELRVLSGDAMRYRRQILALKQFLSGRKTSAIFWTTGPQ